MNVPTRVWGALLLLAATAQAAELDDGSATVAVAPVEVMAIPIPKQVQEDLAAVAELDQGIAELTGKDAELGRREQNRLGKLRSKRAKVAERLSKACDQTLAPYRHQLFMLREQVGRLRIRLNRGLVESARRQELQTELTALAPQIDELAAAITVFEQTTTLPVLD